MSSETPLYIKGIYLIVFGAVLLLPIGLSTLFNIQIADNLLYANMAAVGSIGSIILTLGISFVLYNSLMELSKHRW